MSRSKSLAVLVVLVLAAVAWAGVQLPADSYWCPLAGDPVENVYFGVSFDGAMHCGENTFYKDYETGMYVSPTCSDVWDFSDATHACRTRPGQGTKSGALFAGM